MINRTTSDVGRSPEALLRRVQTGEHVNRCMRSGSFREAIPSLELLRVEDRNVSDFASLSRVLEALAFAYRELGRSQQCEAVVLEAIELERSFGTPSREAMFCNNLATLFRASGRYFEAFKCYSRALGV